MTRSVLAGLVLAISVACGTSAGTSPSATASATVSAPASASNAAASTAVASPSPLASSSSASASSTIDACTLLTASDVAAVIGAVNDQPVQTSAPMTGIATHASVCAYRGATGLLTVAVLTQAMDRSTFDNVMRQVPGVQPISGIGDAAYGTAAGTNGANGASILVLKGTTYFTIVATSASSDGNAMLGSLKTLATKAAGKI